MRHPFLPACPLSGAVGGKAFREVPPLCVSTVEFRGPCRPVWGGEVGGELLSREYCPGGGRGGGGVCRRPNHLYTHPSQGGPEREATPPYLPGLGRAETSPPCKPPPKPVSAPPRLRNGGREWGRHIQQPLSAGQRAQASGSVLGSGPRGALSPPPPGSRDGGRKPDPQTREGAVG